MGNVKKVDELDLAEIDRLIAKVEEIYCARIVGEFDVRIDEKSQVLLITRDGRDVRFTPSTDWRQGGPLLERNDISVEKVNRGWCAHLDHTSVATGATVLIACMRARLKMTYGEEVDVGEL